VACAPSRITPPNRPWFWIASLIKRKASTPPALAYDVPYAVGRLSTDIRNVPILTTLEMSPFLLLIANNIAVAECEPG
jgi:hypothetical protein